MPDQTSVEICGNSPARQAVCRLTDLQIKVRVVALIGPGHVGKSSFIRGRLSELLSESDLSFPDLGVDGIRDARDFLACGPLFSPYKAVVIDDADHLSEPAQDAMLKLLEEPPERARIVLSMEDEGNLSPALQSRLEYVVRWTILNEAEMRNFANEKFRIQEDALKLCRGRPGLYSLLLEDSQYLELYGQCAMAVSGKTDPLLTKVPTIITSLKSGRSIERDAVCNSIIAAVSEFRAIPAFAPAIRGFLRLASDIAKIPSLNAELHWRRACVQARSKTV